MNYDKRKKTLNIIERSILWVDGDIMFISPKNSFWIVWQGHMVQ